MLRKIALVLLASAFAVGAAGCGENKDEGAAPKAPEKAPDAGKK